MAVSRFSILLVNSSGDAQTGQTVSMYDSDDNLVADTTASPGGMTDNGDGTYYVDLDTEGLDPGDYSFKVGGAAQDDLTDIYIGTAKNIYQGQLDDTTIEIAGGIVRVKDDGVTAAKLNSNTAGTGIVQDTDGSLKIDTAASGSPASNKFWDSDVINTKLNGKAGSTDTKDADEISLADSGGYYPTDDAESAFQKLAQRVGFASGNTGVLNIPNSWPIIGGFSALTEVGKRLATVVQNLREAVTAVTTETGGYLAATTVSAGGLGAVDMEYPGGATIGLVMLRDGSISRVAMRYTVDTAESSVNTSTTIQVDGVENSDLRAEGHANTTGGKTFTTTDGAINVQEGDILKLGMEIDNNGSGDVTISDVIVRVEIEY